MNVLGTLLILISLAVGFVALISVVYPLRFLKITTRARALLLLVASVVVFGLGGAAVAPDSDTKARPGATTIEAPKPAVAEAAPASVAAAKVAPTIVLPDSERRLIEIVQDARRRFDEAKNDLARGATRPARAKAICAALRPGSVKDWIGTVHKLSSNNDGKGVLTVEIAPDIRVTTVNNAMSDAIYPSLIDGSSPLLAKAAALSIGQRIKFSGRFFENDADCLAESSVTQRGSMRSPDFVFRFSSIDPI